MSKQDMLKVQTCVLRVNIHCDCEGCVHKVKKSLQKVEGVYKVSIDAEQGRVVVSGNADPASLIKKLEKAGKHAELWGPPQKGGAAPFPISMDQLKKFQMESFNKGNQKKGNHHEQQQPQMVMKNGFVQLPMKKGGAKDEKFPTKDHKSVRFDVPEHDDDDDDDYDDDDFDDEFDDEDDDDFEDDFGETDVHHKPLVKGAGAGGGGGGQKPSKAAGNPNKGDKGGGKDGKDGKAKKGGGGGGIDMFFKGMLKKAGGKKKGKSDKGGKKGENKKEEGGGKNGGGKKGGFELGDGKKGKNDDGNWSKKAGEDFHGGKHQHHQQPFNEMKANHKGGGGGGGGGRNMEMMGGSPAVAGLPAMNGGRFPGAGPGMNPYNQQQYMAQMMMMNQMNQQRENGHEAAAAAYHPMAYARPPPAMSYGPPPPHMGYGGPMHPQHMGYGPPAASGEYAHMFSDENTDSCGIM